MRLIACILFLLPILTFPIIIDRKELIAPKNIWSILFFIKISIPGMLYCNTQTVESMRNFFLKSYMIQDGLFLQYAFLQTISYYLVIFGMQVVFKTRRGIYLHANDNMSMNNSFDDSRYACNRESMVGYRVWGILLTTVGIIAFLVVMAKVGGIFYFFTHLQYRVSLTRNLDTLTWLMSGLNYGPLLLVYSLKGSRKQLSIPLIILLMMCGFMNGLGGRKDLIMMLVQALFIYHFSVAPIVIRDYIKPKYIITLVIALAFFIVFAELRTEGAVEEFLTNPFVFFSNSNKGLLGMVRSESYLPYYVAIMGYFANHSLWKGASFRGLLTAPIPSSLYSNKPPVDDGMYLYSISRGHEVVPVLPTRELDGSSFPLETFGSMYANFGVIGVIIGMIILGAIIGYCFRKMKRKEYALIYILIYTQAVFNFQLSTLRIFQLLITIVLATIVTWSVSKIRFVLHIKR